MSKEHRSIGRSLARGALVLALVSLLGLALAAPAGAQTTQSLEVTIENHLGKQKQAELCGLVLCGTTTIPGYGEARYVIVPTGVTLTSRSCGDVSAVASLEFTDGSGTLSFALEGQICYPGNSTNTPGVTRAFGNPFQATATYTITAGTGVFAGAGGTGTASVTSAGAHVVARLSGTLTLP